MSVKSYWLKRRDNPQLDKPYYVKCGQLSKTAARKKENSLYGSNTMIEYVTAAEYEKAIEKLKRAGFTVNER